MKTFDFGLALTLIKEGRKVARKSWPFVNEYIMKADPKVDYGVPTEGIVSLSANGRAHFLDLSGEDLMAQDWVLWGE